MITVVETWRLRPEYTDRALSLMQEMDELVGPPAHRDPAWSGHAHFYQSQDRPGEVLMVYPWRSQQEHAKLADAEESLLADFQATYCAEPRRIEYFTELPVDVDHDETAVHH